jgi:hypothetical protein
LFLTKKGVALAPLDEGIKNFIVRAEFGGELERSGKMRRTYLLGLSRPGSLVEYSTVLITRQLALARET